MVTRISSAIAAAALAAAPAPAATRAVDFVLVNGTGTPLQGLSIRRFGTGAWRSLSAATRPGERRALRFDDEYCAFDIQAMLEGREALVWSGVNLCEARAVILNRDQSGAVWVDYD